MSASIRISKLPKPVILDRYVVCKDYWHDAGRLYLAHGDGEHCKWTLLGEGVWVYPNPEDRTVSIDFPYMNGINTTEAELDAHDGYSFSRALLQAGYKPESGKAWYILDYVRTAVAKEVAVTPHGIVDASDWAGLVHLRMDRLGWFDGARAARKTEDEAVFAAG